MMKHFLSILVAVMMIIVSTGMPILSVSASDQDTIAQMIGYYQSHGSAAHTDIARLTEELAQSDAGKAQTWSEIMAYWEYVNEDMEVYTDVLPDGLPDDDTLCITVLGYALNADGTMKDELVGRLQVALDSAERYPNAYVACTGGGTASQNPLATEADQMAAWLEEQGLDKDRIIVENRSKSTVQNAEFTYALLRKNYPHITNLAIVTSDYHVPRGCLLYNAQLLLSAYKAADLPLNIVGNAGYQAGHGGYEAVSLQASGIAQIAGISLSGTTPVLSELTQITVQGKTVYECGEQLELQVTADYNSHFAYDVTERAVITGYDPHQEGTQTLTVTYEENGTTRTAEVTVTVNNTNNNTNNNAPAPTWVIPLVICATVLIIAVMIIVVLLKRNKNTKS